MIIFLVDITFYACIFMNIFQFRLKIDKLFMSTLLVHLFFYETFKIFSYHVEYHDSLYNINIIKYLIFHKPKVFNFKIFINYRNFKQFHIKKYKKISNIIYVIKLKIS